MSRRAARPADRGGRALALMLLLAAVCGYLLGSFPTGYLLGKLRGLDIRQFGSGATGGTNVLRTMGWGPALLTALGDVAKGALAAWMGLAWAGEWGYVAAGLAAMVGHSYPVWIGWRGGKAVGTGAGALLVTHPASVGIGLIIALAFVIPTRWVGLGSIVGAVTMLVYLSLKGGTPDIVFGLGAAALVIWRHRANITRMLAGTENRFGQKAVPIANGDHKAS